MNGVTFPINVLCGKQGSGKKLTKSIQRLIQVLGIYIKKVIGVLLRGVSIVTATMLTDKLLILTGLRITLSTQKQHMLKKVRQAASIFRVITTTNAYIQ